jgi:hypothetical protein
VTEAGALTVAAAQPICVAHDVTANAASHAEVIRAADARVVAFLCSLRSGSKPRLAWAGAGSVSPGDRCPRVGLVRAVGPRPDGAL